MQQKKTQKNSLKTRYAYLDWVRFFAFFCIIYYHILVQLHLDGIVPLAAVEPLFSRPNLHIASLGVQLFFMISGAGLMVSSLREEQAAGKQDVGKQNAGKRWIRFYEKRIFRILIPFYLVWAAYYVIKRIVWRGPVFDAGIPKWRIVFTLLGLDNYMEMAGVRTFAQGIGEWFLGCLILLYAVFPLLYRLMRRFPKAVLLAATVLYTALTLRYPFRSIPVNMNVCMKLYPFVLGMLLGFIDEEKKTRFGTGTVPVILSAAVLLAFILLPAALPVPEEWSSLIAAAVFILLLRAMEPILHEPAWFRWLLRNSYEIFLVHHIVIYQLTERIHVIPLLIPLELVMMLLGGAVLHQVTERIKK